MTLPLWPADEPAGPRTVSLVRLAGEIARSVATVGQIAVEGEVHRPTTSRGGWVFFTLRDRAAQIGVVCPRVNVRRCRTVPGERVSVVGSLQWSNERGQLNLVAESVTPVGAGAIAAMIGEARRRLAADGLIDRPRRPLPRLPGCIGVVCGVDAAVRKDIESVVAARFPGYPLRFVEATVSGPGAPISIVEALHEAVEDPAVEVVILARGGGDATQLLAWSDEDVCRAVAAAPVPVVSAIGHDADRPLCDEVADLRCATPSVAAAAVVPDRAALEATLDANLSSAARGLRARLDAAQRRCEAIDAGQAVETGLERGWARLDRGRERLVLLHPQARLRACQQRLASLDWRGPWGQRVGRAAGRLEADRRHLEALSPARVLERGFAVVRRADGQVVRRFDSVAVGETVDVRLATGHLVARVEETSNG